MPSRPTTAYPAVSAATQAGNRSPGTPARRESRMLLGSQARQARPSRPTKGIETVPGWRNDRRPMPQTRPPGVRAARSGGIGNAAAPWGPDRTWRRHSCGDASAAGCDGSARTERSRTRPSCGDVARRARAWTGRGPGRRTAADRDAGHRDRRVGPAGDVARRPGGGANREEGSGCGLERPATGKGVCAAVERGVRWLKVRVWATMIASPARPCEHRIGRSRCRGTAGRVAG